MKIIKILIFLAVILYVLSFDFSGLSKTPTYGVSFSRFHADELKLDWKETYLAILNDLGVRHFRFSAHWPLTEPKQEQFNFTELDFQMDKAAAKGADAIIAVGRRLPGWPECHVPDWAAGLSKEKQQDEILNYIKKVVDRYKKYSNLKYWQVENEPFLGFFSKQACGELDKNFMDQEIALVRQLDPSHQILITDSGEFGTWFQAYKHGDVFGTSIYLYVWWRHNIGPFRYPIVPAFFRVKSNIMSLIYGHKPSMVIELSAEPWLLQPITDTSLDVQFQRMGVDKFNEMIDFSSKAGFDTFYLWGAEWWYWLKLKGHPEHWDRALKLYSSPQ